MNEYVIRVVEDEEEKPFRKFLEHRLGDYADWDVYPTATQAIRWLRQQQRAPDVVLIDLRLTDPREDEALVGDNLHYGDHRGLLVMSSILQHPGSNRSRIALYTAYFDELRTRLGPLVSPPSGIPPLIRVFNKGKSDRADGPERSSTEMLCDWLREQLHEVARWRLRRAPLSLNVRQQLLRRYIELRDAWEPTQARLSDDFRRIHTIAKALADEWDRLKAEEHPDPVVRCLPSCGLREATNSGIIRVLLKENPMAPGTELLRQAVGEYETRHRSELTEARAIAHELMDSLSEDPSFKEIAVLFPLEAQAISSLGAPSVMLESLRAILEVAAAVDYHEVLGCFLKTREVEGRQVYLTATAEVVHTVPGLQFALDSHLDGGGALPAIIDVTLQGRTLCADLGPKSSCMSTDLEGVVARMGVELARLPEPTQARMLAAGEFWGGEGFRDGGERIHFNAAPLLCFGIAYNWRGSSERKHWHGDWTQRLFEAGYEVTGSCSDSFLTDWRYWFGPSPEVPRQEGERLLRLREELGRTKVTVMEDGARITIHFSSDDHGAYPASFADEFSSQSGRSTGGLGAILWDLSEWGELTVQCKCRTGSLGEFHVLRILLPGSGEPSVVPMPVTELAREPKLQLWWRIVNYAHTEGRREPPPHSPLG